MITLIRLTAGSLLATSLLGCGGGSDSGTDAEGPLGDAYEKCATQLDGTDEDPDAPPLDDYLRLEDEGTSIIVNTPDSDDPIMGSLLGAASAGCVLDALDAPTSVGEKMESTTPIMGRQSDSWDEYSVEWSYSSDTGLEAFFEAER